ncbi:hypothetical protein [Novosphingobium beihaiensis]|uniref:Uncharacterized protein n=1 Tax=Novosphingobium beihaiensis TaxID=2930389 RepID=A0ABT0BKK9_9SPHN|nr:hypothetical protein [Novosphingobium beihaiensis]MCJ2185386.1 hypothetical protein [Novosphingobium beihaiensis]
MKEVKAQEGVSSRVEEDKARKSWKHPEVQEIDVAFVTMSAFSGSSDAITST